MKNADFEGVMQGLGEARQFARGKRVPGLVVRIPPELDIAAIRKQTGLSQPNFAQAIGIRVATLRNWEQGRRAPEGPARVLLAMLGRNPGIVAEVLGAAQEPAATRRVIPPRTQLERTGGESRVAARRARG